MSHMEPTVTGGRRTAAIVILVLLTLLVAGAVAVEAFVEPPDAPVAEPVALEPPASGTWYCPVTAAEDETAVLSIASAGAEPSTVTVLRHRPEGEAPGEPQEVAAGGVTDIVLEGPEATIPSSVRWSGGPVVVTWRVEGTDTAGARCENAPEPVWYVAGFETTAQSRSRLHLYNPFSVDATAEVVFGTATGEEQLELTRNVLVPAFRNVVLDLNEFQPEQPDLAATVRVLAGRLIAQGDVALAPTANQPGPTGRDVLGAAPRPGLQWSSAYARADETSSTWLSLYNPGDREAAVEVRVSNPLPDAAVLLEETSVPAGGVVRVDLSEVSSSTEFGAFVASVNEVPVVMTRLTTARTGGGAEGLAASVGDEPARRWAMAGAGTDQRQSRLALYNPGAEPVTVAVDAGEGTPPEWGSITLQPNEQVTRELSEVADDRGAIGLRIEADGPIVADVRVQSPGDGLRFWTVGGVPSQDWEGPAQRPAVRRDARLSTRPAEIEPVEEGEGAVDDAVGEDPVRDDAADDPVEDDAVDALPTESDLVDGAAEESAGG